MKGTIDENMIASDGTLMPNIDGGYPVLYFAEIDGDELVGPFCAPCASGPECDPKPDQWHAFYEGAPELCEACGVEIKSAYGDPDEPAEPTEKDWALVSGKLPPEGELVDTISPTGATQRLRRRGRLWFVEDDGMYVYYTPQFWRSI